MILEFSFSTFLKVTVGGFVNQLIKKFWSYRDFCRLPITFVNCLDTDQDQQNVGPELDPTCLTL